MNARRCLAAAMLVSLCVVTVGAPLWAQTTTPSRTQPPVDPTAPTVQSPPQETPPIDRFEQEFGFRRRYWRPVLRIGQDFTLRASERVRSVTVAFGRARIEGRVEGDLAVIFGPVTLAKTAVIEGSFVVVGGDATVEPGAIVRDEVIMIGAGMDVPQDFYFGGEHIVIGTRYLGTWMESVVPWITGGLLLGRPIVPGIGWVWSVLALFFITYLIINLVAFEPVGATAGVLAERPLGSFMAGLLVLLLAGPVSALLAVSVIGIAVIPFALAALVAAGVVGRVGVLRWIGNSVMTPDDPDSRALALRSFAIGFALLTLTYMLPLLGLVAWAMFGVLGLGAAVLAFLTAWRKEHPKPERPPSGPKGSPVPPPAPAAPAGTGGPSPAAAPHSPAPSGAAYAQTSGFVAGPATFAGSDVRSSGAAADDPAGATPIGGGAAPAVASAAASGSGGASASADASASQARLVLFPRASFLDRAAAFVLDVVLVMFIVQVLRPVFYYRDDNFFLVMLLAYFTAFWTWKGTTIGGIVTNLRVIKVGNGELTFPECLVRSLMGVLSFGALGIGVLWILRNDTAADGLPARQGWHDLATGTYVVKVPKGYPLP